VHILITADTLGGVWTYTRELVCGLLQRGHQVTLVSFGAKPSPAHSTWLPRGRLTYIPTEFPLEWMQNAEQGIQDSLRFLDDLCQQCRPDVLHLSQFCYGALAYEGPKVVVAHSDVVSWWQAVHESDPPRDSWFEWYRTVVSDGVAGADVLIAPSRWMLEAMLHNYGRHPNASVIYNGRSPHLFYASDKKNCALSVGRLWDQAKQSAMLLAYAHPIPVMLAGSTQHPEGASHSSAIPESQHLTCLGEQNDEQLRHHYAESAIYAATSRYEPFGLAAVEAALSGCALIANDIATFRELWGDAAFYFKANDSNALAAALAELAGNPILREDFAQRAYHRALNCFAAEIMVTQYDMLYQNVTANSWRAVA
jgi:glycogen(starch) synthase